MSSSGPAHRSVSSIRPEIRGVSTSPSTPHTPLRNISSTYGSPSALRAEEECVVIELGSRHIRAGFAGDATPKADIYFGPEEQRRAGDYRKWSLGYEQNWRERAKDKEYGQAHELWRPDLRNTDLGLVSDKLERAIREAFTKYLLIDSRARRMTLAIPSTFPLPLLSTVLDTMFTNFQPPNISLLSSPALTTVAAGLRAALVVDIGWAETVVTGVYEFREVHCQRSTRASKALGQEMQRMLIMAAGESIKQEGYDAQEIISFEECEEVVARLAWCKSLKKSETVHSPHGLATVTEEDEMRSSLRALEITSTEEPDPMIAIPLQSTNPPTTLKLPFSKLSGPCETALLATGTPLQDLDDEELPLPMLVYRTLLQLPVDLRSMCMSRIIFVGGGSNLIGLKSRILDEVASITEHRGWDPVQGKAVEQLRSNPKLKHNRNKQAGEGPTKLEIVDPTGPKISAALQDQELDPIEDQIRREANKGSVPVEKGYLRAVDSLGAWSGASLLSQLKIPSISVIDREQWSQHGAAGASRSGEAEVSVARQRQSMGPGAIKSGAGERSSWTLGMWA
ncbi:actin-like ATPase-containing protein [Coleophoma crateriformis]|uniref:Actin-like ATPase-containing protein n=1 Tax=Coleophoma crateriformis TaxID=565419 RepID=A0A3D8R358_9HELO|nr:actin-like ATPase-containing protein [Coleophoma crateriformis]